MSTSAAHNALNAWLGNTTHPVVVAGPCSAESEEQVHTVAQAIAQNPNVRIMRSGIWKPRTRPGSFEGMGNQALPWLAAAAKQNGLLSTCEVATAEHVEAALKAGISVLWIGARTTVNPFSVQEIADALQGVAVPVMVKNPVSPDVQLWLGAIERVHRASIQHIVAIHRGFNSGIKSVYRNNPLWELALELKALAPHIPMFADPSHIAGDAHKIAEVAQKALDLDYNGLMIETHPNPPAALSDAKQQVTPAQLLTILAELEIRTASSGNAVFESQLTELRKVIDGIDDELLDILARRMAVIEKIGQYKHDNRVTVFQLARFKEIIQTRTANGIVKGLDSDFVKAIFKEIHRESAHLQTELNKNKLAN